MDEEDENSPSQFSIIVNIWKLLIQKLKRALQKARRPQTILSTNKKSANTNKKKATDMNTLLRYIEANGIKNEKIEI